MKVLIGHRPLSALLNDILECKFMKIIIDVTSEPCHCLEYFNAIVLDMFSNSSNINIYPIIICAINITSSSTLWIAPYSAPSGVGDEFMLIIRALTNGVYSIAFLILCFSIALKFALMSARAK
jgi:hypothetical protein